MELFANLTSRRYPAPEFAQFAERSGFDGVTCSDHYWVSDVFPHVWVSLAAMAMSTSRITVAPSFVNNLVRSPFEFAQASLQLHELSGGRYEAGLGAGWAEAEIVATGQRYPSGPERARQYRESLLIVRELLSTGRCDFDGEFHHVHTPALPSLTAAPIPLVASVGGPWTIRHITPIVDRVELKLISGATRGGSLDLGVMATIVEDDLRRMVDAVRAVRDDIPIGLFLMVGAGEGPKLDALRATLGDSFCGRFVGEPSGVLAHLRSLESLGISRVQITEFAPDTISRLADELAR